MSKSHVNNQWHREFDHTGDLGIEVEGESLAAIFEEAALGMFALLTDLESVAPTRSVEISLSTDASADLLYKWLSELNFLHLTERVVFARFEIAEISPTGLKAIAYGESIDPGRHPIHTEIKAVTHHELKVELRNERWHARIIFDI